MRKKCKRCNYYYILIERERKKSEGEKYEQVQKEGDSVREILKYSLKERER